MKINIKNLHDCLIYNNRFGKNTKLTAEHIGAEGLASWKSAIGNIHREAYKVSFHCENNDLTTVDSTIDMAPLYSAIRELLAIVGEVNGHKLNANFEVALCAVKYASKIADTDSPNLMFVKSQIANVKKQLRDVEEFGNGVNKEYITSLNTRLAELEAEKSKLLAEPDNRIARPTRTSENDFRGNMEHRLARIITNQKSKSWEELEAEAKARKDAKNKKNNDRKKAQRAEAKKSESK